MSDYKTHSHIEEIKQSINEIQTSDKKGHIIKNFILKWGRKFVDILSWFGVILAIIVLIATITSYCICMAIGKQLYYYNDYYFVICNSAFGIMLFLPIIILIITIMSNYFLYLMIDIRDSLKKISEK